MHVYQLHLLTCLNTATATRENVRNVGSGVAIGCAKSRVPEFQVKIFCCMGVLCTWVKLLTGLQILGCELHKYAFGGRALPGPTGGAIALPRPPSHYKGVCCVSAGIRAAVTSRTSGAVSVQRQPLQQRLQQQQQAVSARQPLSAT